MSICYRSNADFLRRDIGEGGRFYFVGTEEAPGVRAAFGPIVREEYEGDNEPMIEEGPFRPISWRTHMHARVPAGWRKGRIAPIIRRHGFVDVQEVGDCRDRYWSAQAKRHERAWMKEQREWQMVEPTLEEFIAGMRATDKDILFKAMFIDSLRRIARGHGGLLHLRALRRADGPLEVGLATVDVPECRLSFHHIAFTLPSARASSAGTGLIMEWFDRAMAQKLHALHFGVFWAPGSPKDWKGFSRFKAQFGVQMMDLPHPLVRWAGRMRENIQRLYV
ncbi:hypothetical protein HYW18_02870 [Candidatus Uhrbacteria bacterium]|nr:hypothetical protein [Candidatus Uhrbacteria bacterium]